MDFSDSHEWVLWMARNAVGERRLEPALIAPKSDQPKLSKRRRRKRHWAGTFQVKFSHWLKGDGERPLNLGYTRRDLMRHLERQFAKGMTWENYAGNMPFRSRDVWVVDHIVPKSQFCEHEVDVAYALSNLRPLWISENMLKGMVKAHLL